MKLLRSPLSVLIVSGLITLASGCAVVSSHHDSYVTGHSVSDETLARVEPGVSTEAWLVATLGEPTEAETVDAHVRILKYASKRITKYDTELLFVFDTSSRSEKSQTVFFEMRDGVLTRYWQESETSSHR